MATIVNKAPVFGLVGAVLNLRTTAGVNYDAAAYVSPNLTDCSLSHVVQVDKTLGQDGNTNMLVSYDEKLELSLSYILQGSTIANAKLSGILPIPLTEVKLTGASVVPVGGFADAFNSPADGVPGTRWLYEGGGTVEMTSTGKAVGKMTIHRYQSVTGTTIPTI